MTNAKPLPLDRDEQQEDAARLKALFKAREEKISQMEFGQKYEIGNQAMVWQYLNGKRPLNIKAASAFARGLKVSVQSFSPSLSSQIEAAAKVGSNPDPEQHIEALLPQTGVRVTVREEADPYFVPVKLVSLRLSAGVSGFRTEETFEDNSRLAVPRLWVEKNRYAALKLIATRVKGESMEPTLHDGDIVVINTNDTKPVDGGVFAINYEGEAVVKRLSRDAGDWWLTSDNVDQRRYHRKLCRDGECIIIGRVVRKESDNI